MVRSRCSSAVREIFTYPPLFAARPRDRPLRLFNALPTPRLAMRPKLRAPPKISHMVGDGGWAQIHRCSPMCPPSRRTQLHGDTYSRSLNCRARYIRRLTSYSKLSYAALKPQCGDESPINAGWELRRSKSDRGPTHADDSPGGQVKCR